MTKAFRTFFGTRPSFLRALVVGGIIGFSASPGIARADDDDRKEQVGFANTNHIVLPVNQILSPAGLQIQLPGKRPQVLALSPNGRRLVVAGNFHKLVVIDPVKGVVLQEVPLPSEAADNGDKAVSSHILKPDSEGQASFTGLTFSPDGTRVFLANVGGSIKVFGVDSSDLLTPLYSISVRHNDGYAEHEIPAGLACSKDGRSLFVVLNLSNRLVEIDLTTGKPKRFFDCGVEPYQIALVGAKAYVSNWGGRRPEMGSVTGPAGKGTKVRVDPIRFIANEGSVSVIDLGGGRVVKEILTGLHASGMALSPDQRYLTVANAASESVTVIDTRSEQIVENISLKWHKSDLFGASPNALAFDTSGRNLYVCNGTQNAVASIRFKPGHSTLRGLIPVGWFPGDIAFLPSLHRLCVANIKGLGSGKEFGPNDRKKYNSHQYFGSISLVEVPNDSALKDDTAVVFSNYRRLRVEASQLPPRAGVAPRPVPERTGEPSLHNHVVYIIKENRTYDQILGDMAEGNGDPRLCIFGDRVTPNQHKMCREFALLDNTHCSGILSADGHQWADTAFATDYMEKSFVGFPRSYPDGMEESDIDAMAYSPAGFIWDNAVAHGKSLRDFGEFTMGRIRWSDPAKKGEPKFAEIYRDYRDRRNSIIIGSVPAIGSLGPYIVTNTIGWALEVPDAYRADRFIAELKEYEAQGEMPELTIICLPNDHTSGTHQDRPTPSAQVADNDLAFGRIVSAISHSRFWKDTCLAIEDDPQAGVDHVDSYRTTAYVISPYVKRHSVIKSNYNQTSLLRTLELMLGLPPMNQMDASASPMVDCFSETADLTPYDFVPNNVPLDDMNPPPEAISNPVLRKYAIASSKLPLDEPDQCPEDLLNRILWAAQKGPDVPYPTWAVTKLPKARN